MSTATTCKECERREEEIAALRRELSDVRAWESREAFRSAFRLTPGEGRVLALLYGARGRLVTHATLDRFALSEKGYENGAGSVKTVISRLRAKVGHAWIQTVHGSGYRLSEVALDILDRFKSAEAGR